MVKQEHSEKENFDPIQFQSDIEKIKKNYSEEIEQEQQAELEFKKFIETNGSIEIASIGSNMSEGTILWAFQRVTLEKDYIYMFWPAKV